MRARVSPFAQGQHGIGYSHSLLAAAAEKAKANGEDKEESFKGDSTRKFSSHLKASTAMSAFAKSRTLKEQREYLPAFACREELLKIIRDNQGSYIISGLLECDR